MFQFAKRCMQAPSFYAMKQNIQLMRVLTKQFYVLQSIPLYNKMFEFVCYLFHEDFPSKASYGNQLLVILFQRERLVLSECAIAIRFFSRYVYYFDDLLFEQHDEFGKLYFTLLLESLQFMKDHSEQYTYKTERLAPLIYEAKLLYELKEHHGKQSYRHLMGAVLRDTLSLN